MKLSLARWEYNGCSRGYWMVRELPGVAIINSWGSVWMVSAIPYLYDDCPEAAERVWGEGFEFTDLSRMSDDRFPSRSSALLALERFFAPAQSSSLVESLSL